MLAASAARFLGVFLGAVAVVGENLADGHGVVWIRGRDADRVVPGLDQSAEVNDDAGHTSLDCFPFSCGVADES